MRAKRTVDNYGCLKSFAVKRRTQCTCRRIDVILTRDLKCSMARRSTQIKVCENVFRRRIWRQKTRIGKPHQYAGNDRYHKMHEKFNFSENMILTIMLPDNTRKISNVSTSLTTSFLLCLLRFTDF